LGGRIAVTPGADHGTSESAPGQSKLGLIGLLDPPRQEAVEAVKECHEGGIRVTMITGDHKITAAAIAKMLGIGDGKTAIAGAEIEDMDTATLEDRVRDVDVFARASPEHKLRLRPSRRHRSFGSTCVIFFQVVEAEKLMIRWSRRRATSIVAGARPGRLAPAH
jgi:haloacid dehalogenase-like hydrolase